MINSPVNLAPGKRHGSVADRRHRGGPPTSLAMPASAVAGGAYGVVTIVLKELLQ
jgi:hypothetical protein